MKGNLCPSFGTEILEFTLNSNLLGERISEFPITVHSDSESFFEFEGDWKTELQE